MINSTLSPQMYKKHKRLVYTPPDLLARFCTVNLSEKKIRPDLFSKNLFSRPQSTVIKSPLQ